MKLGVIVLLGLLIACSSPTGEVVLEKEQVTIGAIIDLTGKTASVGEDMKNAIEIGVEEINTEGINGKRLEILYQDDRCDQKMAVAAAHYLIQKEDVKIIIGPTCSSNAMAVAPIAETAKVIILTPSASVPALKHTGDYIFRNKISGDIPAKAVAELSYEHLQARTASILYVNLDNGVAYRDAFRDRFEELGGKILAMQSFHRDDRDFRTQLLKIKESDADVFFLATQINPGLVVRQAREIGLTVQIVGPHSVQVPDLLTVGGEAAEGLIYSYPAFDENSDETNVADFQTKFKQRFGRPSDVHAANSYDAVKLLADAIRKCGEETGCIRDYLYEIKNYSGASGTITFDEYGEVHKEIMFKTVRNGEFVTYP